MAAGQRLCQYDGNSFLMREQRVLLNADQVIIISRPNRKTNTKAPRRSRRQLARPTTMEGPSSSSSSNQEDGGSTTKDELRRMTLALTDQATIEQLSRAGHAAQMKREELHALARRNRELREQRAQQPHGDQEEPEPESEGQDGDSDKDDDDDDDGNSEDEDPEEDSEEDSDDSSSSSSSSEEEDDSEEDDEDEYDDEYEDDFEGFDMEFNMDFQL